MKYLFLFVFATSFFSCRFIGGKRVRGNGDLVTRERSVSGFEGVDNYGSFDITLVPAASASVKVEAEENLQQYIETYVSDNKLQIRTADGYNLRPRRDMKITVFSPVFRTITTNGSGSIVGQGLLNTNNADVSLKVAGSGNIEVEMNAERIRTEIAGSGNISVKGTSKRFEGGVYGSGNIRAGNLQADDSKVEIAGSGNVDVHANRKLDVSIMGSGEVKHRGSAQVRTSINGSGSVVKVD